MSNIINGISMTRVGIIDADFAFPNMRTFKNTIFVKEVAKKAKQSGDFLLFGFCIKMLTGRVPFDIKLIAGNLYRKRPIQRTDPIHKLEDFLIGPTNSTLIIPKTAKID